MPNIDAVKAVRAYLQQEPDLLLRNEANALLNDLEAGDVAAAAQIQDRFVGHLAFGTAGMRAQMESGFRRLNLVTVGKAAFAIGTFVREGGKSVVVGHDARNNSRLFAREISAVLRGLGLFVYEFDEAVATPICAFAVTQVAASAAIMVTASHNPPRDNGLKVYGANGAQIVSPADNLIEANLKNAPSYHDIVRSKQTAESGRTLKLSEILDPYLEGLSQAKISPLAEREELRVIYTPLHGVGLRFVEEALSGHSFIELLPVASQKDQDGNFPTLKFPNPEEEGALDLAIADAQSKNADLIVANDPDADRLAVAARRFVGGDFVMLTGNELGAIIGCDVLENSKTAKRKLAVSTLVSSRQLRAIAAGCNASYAEGLTGFSRIAQIAFEREANHGEQFVFGFEEALGYCVGNLVHDKDGVSAAVRLLERAALLKADGKTLWDELDRIALKYGLFRNQQWSFRYSGVDAQESMQTMMTSLRKLNVGATFFGGEKIKSRHDLQSEQYEDFARANILVFFLEDGTRVVVRPSGTEPKVKFYAEKSASPDSMKSLEAHREKLDGELLALRQNVTLALGDQP